MSKLIGTIGGTPDEPWVIVSTSTAGVEVQSDPEFTLTSDQTIAYATLLMQAVRSRLDVIGEIRDPAGLVALIPSDPGSTRVVRRARRS